MSLSSKLSIKDIDVKNKKVLVRVDYNVPLNDSLEVTDSRRIKATIPTIKTLIDKGARTIVLISHMGRPNGIYNEKLSLKHIIPVINKELKHVSKSEIQFIESFDSENYNEATSKTDSFGIYLFENLRFNPEEEGKGKDSNGNKIKVSKEDIQKFSHKLSALGDIFVFDAFATAHRPHTSVVGIKNKKIAVGHLMNKELIYFSKALNNPTRPFLSILGGAKVSDKILLIENMIDKVNDIIIGGGMAYTFLNVLYNMKIGTSLFDENGSKIVKKIMEKAKRKNVNIHFPIDFTIADKFDKDAKTKECTKEEGIPNDWMGLDCGPKSIVKFTEIIHKSKTVLWNGPLGVFEFEKFCVGTKSVLKVVAEKSKNDKDFVSIIGGGDTASAAEQFGYADYMTHVSTGGGASLELLEGKVLPGISAISDK